MQPPSSASGCQFQKAHIQPPVEPSQLAQHHAGGGQGLGHRDDRAAVAAPVQQPDQIDDIELRGEDWRENAVGRDAPDELWADRLKPAVDHRNPAGKLLDEGGERGTGLHQQQPIRLWSDHLRRLFQPDRRRGQAAHSKVTMSSVLPKEVHIQRFKRLKGSHAKVFSIM